MTALPAAVNGNVRLIELFAKLGGFSGLVALLLLWGAWDFANNKWPATVKELAGTIREVQREQVDERKAVNDRHEKQIERLGASMDKLTDELQKRRGEK